MKIKKFPPYALLGIVLVSIVFSWGMNSTLSAAAAVGSPSGSPSPSPEDPCAADINGEECNENWLENILSAEVKSPPSDVYISGTNASINADIDRTPGNHPPVADSLNLTTTVGTSIPLNLSGFDQDSHSLGISISIPPKHGTISTSNDMYTPDAGFNGQDAFAFTVNDGYRSGGGTVHIQVGNSDNPPPVIGIDDQDVSFHGSLDLSAIITSPQGVSSRLEGPRTRGQLSGLPGSFSYNPLNNFGSDYFYVVAEEDGGHQQVSIKMVKVQIEDPNPAMVAIYDINGNQLTPFSEAWGSLTSLTFSGIDTTLYPDGPNTFFVKATDLSGRTVTAAGVFDIDNTPPTIIWEPGPGSHPAGPLIKGSVGFDVLPSDNVLVKHVEMHIDPITDPNPVDVLYQASAYATSYNTVGSLQDGEHTFTFTAVDGANLVSEPLAVTYTVDNTPPLIAIYFNGTLVNPLTTTEVEGTVRINIQATELVSGMTRLEVLKPGEIVPNPACVNVSPTHPEQSSVTCDWDSTGLTPGVHNVIIKGMNQVGLEGRIEVPVTYGNNRSPLLTSPGNQTGREGDLLSFVIPAGTDPDGDVLTYSAANLPPGATFDTNPLARRFSWTPGFTQAGTYNNVTFTVTDNGTPSKSASQLITITVNDLNRTPIWSAPLANQSGLEGQVLTFTLPEATDPDGNTITYSASNLPGNGTFNPATRVFSWTPGFNEVGSYNNVTFTVTDNGTPNRSASQLIRITMENVNRAPTWTATLLNKSGTENLLLTFILPEATDLDGDSISYSASGLPGNATFNSITREFSWTPGFTDAGSYNNVTFTATDNGSPTKNISQSITITISNKNREPIWVSQLTNQSVNEGQVLTFTLPAATDPDGNAVSYTAAGLPSGASFNTATRVFSWTAGFNTAGIYNNIKFTATDDGVPNLDASQSISITVGNVNRTPTLPAPVNRIVDEGVLLTFTILGGSDPDGDLLTYSATNLPLGATFDATSREFAWTPGFNSLRTYNNVTFTATDNGAPNLSASRTITITVNDVNQPPILSLIGNKTVKQGKSLSFLVSATDPEGNLITYSATGLPVGATFNSSSGQFLWETGPTDSGNYQINFTATDNGSPNRSQSEQITVSVGNVNQPPFWSPPLSNQIGSEGQVLTFTVTAIDPDGDLLTYSATNLPLGATFDPSTRVFNWTPNYTQAQTYTVTFTATDNNPESLSTNKSITITVSNVNQPPTMTSPGNKTVNENQPLTFTLSGGSDPDGDLLTYSAANLPAGATFDATSRVFTWTPGFNSLRTYNNVTFTATDSGIPNKSVSQPIVITVDNVNRAPTMASPVNQITNEDQLLIFTVPIGNDPDGDSLIYSAINLPQNAAFDPVTRVFSWKPSFNQAGSYTNVGFIVTDDGTPTSLSLTRTITITVNNVNQPPILNPIGNKPVFEGQPLTFTVTATDPDNGDILTLAATNLPSGASFDPGTGVFSWTPGFNASGLYSNLTFTVTDNGALVLSDSESINVTVNDVNRPPTFSSPGNQIVYEGQLLTVTVPVATDPEGNAIVYTASNLPANASFDPTSRVLNWTPQEDQNGTQVVSFQATDNGLPPETAEQTITITIKEVNTAPVLAPIPTQYVNGTFTLNISATDSDLPSNVLTYSLNKAPQGVSIDPVSGLFRWTPPSAQQGTYQMIVRVTDNGYPALSDAKNFSIVYDQSAPVISFLGDAPAGPVSNPYPIAVSASDPRLSDVRIFIIDETGIETELIQFDVPPSAAPFSWSLNTAELSNGTYLLKAVALDLSGNSSVVTRSIEVFNQIPTIQIANAADLAYVSRRAAVVISATTTGIIDHVNLKIGAELHTMNSIGGGHYEFNWNTLPPIAAGTYPIEAVAVGPAPLSLESTVARVTTIADFQAPTPVIINLPTQEQADAGLFAVQKFKVTGTDDRLIDHIEFWFGTEQKATARPTIPSNSFSGEFLLDTTSGQTPDGTYPFLAKVYDKAGNLSSMTLNFLVNNSNPPKSEAVITPYPAVNSYVTMDDGSKISYTFDKALDPLGDYSSSIIVKYIENGEEKTLSGITDLEGYKLTFRELPPHNSKVTVSLDNNVRDSEGKYLQKQFSFHRNMAKRDGGKVFYETARGGVFEISIDKEGLDRDMFVGIEFVTEPSGAAPTIDGHRTLDGPFHVYGKNDKDAPEIYVLAKPATISYSEPNGPSQADELNRAIQIVGLNGKPVGAANEQISALVEARSISAHISSLSTFRINSVPVPATGIGGLFCYPNPFSPNEGGTNIQYSLDQDSDVTIAIYDLFGGLVRTLTFAPGSNGGQFPSNTPSWDGRNGEGQSVANGGYILQIVAKNPSGNMSKAKYKVGVVK